LVVEPKTGHSMTKIFQDGRLVSTLVLWLIFFMSLLDVFLLVSWLPTALNVAGIPAQTAILLDALLQAGGILGMLALGFGVDRFGARRILAPAYLLGAVCTAAIGLGSSTSVVVTGIAVFGAGFGIIGGQTAANAVAAALYPTAIRSTGVGWALGVGRIGSIVGPLLAGSWMLAHVSIPRVFIMSAAPALIAACAAMAYGARAKPAS
jgi:AAHS family 4-hydroxybenzoate transporter-like MFS transporter